MKNLNTKVITGIVRLSYANIWQPTSIDDSQEAKYSVSLIIPKTDLKTINAINAVIDSLKQTGLSKWGGKLPPNLKTPLRDGDTDRFDDENYVNSYFMNASCKSRPGIIDLNRQIVMNQEDVYSGCYAVVSINLYAYNSNGNKGIAAGLNNIMKVKDGQPLGGRISAEQDFASIVLGDESLEFLG